MRECQNHQKSNLFGNSGGPAIWAIGIAAPSIGAMTPSPAGSGSDGRGGPAPAVTPSGFISRYQVLEKIGEGGMGSLYLARDPAIDRLVALKVLRRGFDTPELRERFTREARAAGRLRHPNIVTIFDVGEHDGDPFIAMEFLAGETLAELVSHGARLSLARRLKLIEEICDGLAYAHRAGIVHRDIKPANLMVDSEGVLKILDFGIVRLDESAVTQSGVLVGTVNYMSPEQVMGTGIDHRSDIFAVGLVAYELLTGRQAFPGTLKDGLFNKILNVTFEPLTARLPEIDPAIAGIVDRALKREPADRYQDLARMRNDLLRARQRLEAAEEALVEQLGDGSGETVISMVPAPTPAAGTAPKSSPVVEAAERALAAGDYRTALTLAGRSAATAPNDRTISHIMARAQAGLLERGRSLEGSAASRVPPASLEAAPALPAALPRRRLSPVWLVSAGVAIVAVIIAGIVLTRGDQSAPGTSQQSTAAPSPTPPSGGAAPSAPGAPDPSSAATPPPSDPVIVAPPTASTPQAPGRSSNAQKQPQRLPPPGAGERSSGVSPTPAPAPAPPGDAGPPPAAILRVGRDRDVATPRRILYVEPQYPAAGLATRAQGTVRLDLTIGRDGRVADAHVTSSSTPDFDRAALAAVLKWEFAPVTVDARPVTVIYPVTVEFAPPEPAKPAHTEAPPVAVKSSPPASSSAPSAPASPPRAAPDIRAETAAIQDVLRRYEHAWESRDADAVARVHELSPAQLAEVRSTLANAQEYEMAIEVRDISVDPSGRRATVQSSITRAFTPRNGRTARRVTASVVTLEKRGDAWMMTGMR